MKDNPINAKGPAELLIILVAFLLVNAASQAFQMPVSLNGGRGWDGVEYYSMAEQLAEGKLPAAAAPYVYRVGTPFLASLFFKNDLLLGFKVINIVGNLITVILLTLWLRLYLPDWRIRAFLVCIFMAQWHGPVRCVYWHPVYTEPWSLAFLLMGLLGIQQAATKPEFGKVGCLAFISFLGVAFREVCLIMPIALLFATNPVRAAAPLAESDQPTVSQMIRRVPTAFFFPLAIALLSWFAVLYLVTPTSNYSYIKRAVSWGYNQSLALYVHSWFVAYGPIVVLLLYNWRRTGSFLWTNQFMLVYLIGIAVLAWISGTDTVKFLFWAMPVFYLLVGRAIEDNKELLTLPLIVVLVLSQLISERVFWPIPDYPNEYSGGLILFTLIGSKIQYLDLLPSHGSRGIQIFSFLQYLAFSTLILAWFYRRHRIVRNLRLSPGVGPSSGKG